MPAKLAFQIIEAEDNFFFFYFQVQQMKAQNREEKMAKAQEREKLQREIAARERAEKIQVFNPPYQVHPGVG